MGIKSKLKKSNQEILFEDFEELEQPVIIGAGNINVKNKEPTNKIIERIERKQRRKEKKELINLQKLIKLD